MADPGLGESPIATFLDRFALPWRMLSFDTSGKPRIEPAVLPGVVKSIPPSAVEMAKLAEARVVVATSGIAVGPSGRATGATPTDKDAAPGSEPLLLRPDPAACVLEAPPALQEGGPSGLTEAEQAKLQTGGQP